jgi:hypothetical protein
MKTSTSKQLESVHDSFGRVIDRFTTGRLSAEDFLVWVTAQETRFAGYDDVMARKLSGIRRQAEDYIREATERVKRPSRRRAA